MEWIYLKSNDNKNRYALGEICKTPNKLLFCIGINPSTATPEKLDPTATRIKNIALEHGYDSWIILNLCSQISTDPNCMNDIQSDLSHQKNLEIIEDLIKKYGNCGDFLFAYGNLISKKTYLNKNLCDIIQILSTNKLSGNCYCLGKTKKGNPKHPLYQKANTPFALFSTEGYTYSKIIYLNENKCVIQEYSKNGELLFETMGTYNPDTP